MQDLFPACPQALAAWTTRHFGAGSPFELRTLPLHVHEIIGAFVFYHFIGLVVSPFVSRRLAPRVYPHLPRRTRINWDVHFVSQVQAFLICSLAIYVLRNDEIIGGDASLRPGYHPGTGSSSGSSNNNSSGISDAIQTTETVVNELASAQANETTTLLQAAARAFVKAGTHWQGRIFGYSGAAGLVQAMASGYFLWDITVSAVYLSVLGPDSLAHGIAAFMISAIGFRPFGNYYGLALVLFELSTPFLNIHWFLDKLGMTGSFLQLINGLLLIISFFACRLVWGSYLTLRISADVWRALRVKHDPFTLWGMASDVAAASQDGYKGVSGAAAGSGAAASLVDQAGTVLEASSTIIDRGQEAWAARGVPVRMALIFVVSNTLLMFLNFWWWGKMIQALVKRFRKPASPTDKSQATVKSSSGTHAQEEKKTR